MAAYQVIRYLFEEVAFAVPTSIVDQLREEIPALRECVYLNTGTAGPTPEPVLAEVEGLRREFARVGYLDPSQNTARREMVAEARAVVARLLGVDPVEVGFPVNASEGMHLIASGIGLRPNDEVLTTDEEHGGGVWPWESVARLCGAEVRSVPLRRGERFLERLEEAVTERTRAIVVSHVSHASGTRLPVKGVVELAKRVGAWSVIDCAQSLSQLDLTPREWGCDAILSSCHKWTMAPQGTGLAYVRRERLLELEGPYIRPRTGEKHAASAAQHFEYGTRDVLTPIGAARAVRYLEGLGWAQLRDRVRVLSDYLKKELATVGGVELLSPVAWEDSSGLVSVRLTERRSEEVVRQLWEKHRIAVRHLFNEPTGIRVSTAPFNTHDELDLLVDAVKALV